MKRETAWKTTNIIEEVSADLKKLHIISCAFAYKHHKEKFYVSLLNQISSIT